jgi:hypothetical protein
LLVLVERRNALHSALYSGAVVTLTYVVFAYVVKAPLPGGLLGY